MIAWLWLACSGSPVAIPEPGVSTDGRDRGRPDIAASNSAVADIAMALSGYHHVPDLEELSERFPELPTHLRTLALYPETGPLVRSRAWMLLSRTPGAGDLAREAVSDQTLLPATRNKILRGLAEAHPGHAAAVVPLLVCDPSPTVRTTARAVAVALRGSGVEVDGDTGATGCGSP